MHLAQTLPVLAISRHAWLYAHTYALAHTAGLIVFRSPLVRLTDTMYRPVAEILRDFPMRMMMQETIPDEEMMFGEGELTVYRVHGSNMEEELQPVMLKFMNNLKKMGASL
jgi:hypothetical protein